MTRTGSALVAVIQEAYVHGVSTRAVDDLVKAMGADVVVEATQDVVAAIDHSHEGTQAREDARKLQRDIATALDQDTLGHFG